MSQNTARFSKRYTAAQKNALLRAVIIDGHTVAEAVRMAHGGMLEVPAFEINELYAYTVLNKGREAFELANPETLALAIDRELKNLAAVALKEARHVAKQVKAGEANAQALQRSAQALVAIKKALGDNPRQKTPDKTTAHRSNEAESTDASVLANLLASDKQRRSNGKQAARSNGAEPEPGEGARTGSLSRAPNERD